jgi:hypothetical protein
MMRRHRFPIHPAPSGAPVAPAAVRRGGRPAFPLAAPLFALLLTAAPPLAQDAPAAPIDLTGGPGLLGDRETAARERAIESVTLQTRDGLVALAGDYVRGMTTPIPDPVAVDFLLARAAHANDPKLRDAALGAVAAWSALLRNDYFKWGLPDSTTPGRPGPAGRAFKTVETQATLLRLFTRAWQVSERTMFRDAALAAGDDLARWALPANRPGAVHGWTSNDPDTLFGDADALDRFELAASLTQAAHVLDRADWLDRVAPLEAAAIPLAPGDDASPTERRRARRLEVLRLETPGLAPPEGRVTAWAPAPWNWPEGTAASPDDSLEAAWSGLALARYAARAHDDSAKAEVALRLAPLVLAGAPETREMDVFAARAAAALALELHLRPSVMAYVVGDPALAATRALVAAAAKSARPGRLVAVHGPDDPDLLYPPSGDGVPIVYVCSGELCAPPTPEAAEVRNLVDTFALPGAEEADFPSDE